MFKFKYPFKALFMLLLALSLWLDLPQVDAQGFTHWDPNDLEIFGPHLSPPPAYTWGQWKILPHALSILPNDQMRAAFWFPKHIQLSDGFVRLVFEPHKPLDTTLLVRVQFNPSDLNEFSGYGLVLDGRVVRWNRYDRGLAKALSESLKISKLYKYSSLEVVIWLVGPHMVAQIYDAQSLKLLGSVAASDTSYAKGALGIRGHRKQSKKVSYHALYYRPAHQGSSTAPMPAGQKLLATFDPSLFQKLPAALKKQCRILKNAQHYVQCLISPKTLELFYRKGAQASSLSENLPYQLFNAEFRKVKRSGFPSKNHLLDLNASFKDPQMVEALLKYYHRKFPHLTQLKVLGHSHLGYPIWALRISRHSSQHPSKPALLLNAAHHGSELLSIEFVFDAIQYLLENPLDDPRVSRWLNRFDIWCVPLVNPDGNWLYIYKSRAMGRKNGRDIDQDGHLEAWEGVDLNRNYPFQWGALGELGSSQNPRNNYYRGPAPASEPETQAMMALALEYHFFASISYHTVATKILVPYTVQQTPPVLPDEAMPLAQWISSYTGLQPNGRALKVVRSLYPVDGCDQDWLRWRFGTLALLVEGAFHNPRNAQKRRKAVQATRKTWMALLERYENGPTLSLRLSNNKNQPLQREIWVKGWSKFNQEHWFSRKKDGYWHHLMPHHGYVTLQILDQQRIVAQKKVKIKASGITHVHWVLDP